jgi:hypothetical protein
VRLSRGGLFMAREREQSEYGDDMMLSLYVTLGILLLAARNPSANRSLIAFAAWSSFAHATVMSVLGFQHASERVGFLAGSAAARHHRRCLDPAGSGKAVSRAGIGTGYIGNFG